jgi:hypothetical protein
MTPPVVRWGTLGDRWVAFHISRFPIALGIMALFILPFAYWGVFALSAYGEDPAPPWWRTALALLFATAVLGVPIVIGYRAMLAARRAYWLLLNEFGLHLSSGRHPRPILSLTAQQIGQVRMGADHDGNPVLLMTLNPRVRPSEIDGEVAEAGRTLLLRDGLTDAWDLGFVLERRSGDPRMLQAAIERLRGPLPG